MSHIHAPCAHGRLAPSQISLGCLALHNDGLLLSLAHTTKVIADCWLL